MTYSETRWPNVGGFVPETRSIAICPVATETTAWEVISRSRRIAAAKPV